MQGMAKDEEHGLLRTLNSQGCPEKLDAVALGQQFVQAALQGSLDAATLSGYWQPKDPKETVIAKCLVQGCG